MAWVKWWRLAPLNANVHPHDSVNICYCPQVYNLQEFANIQYQVVFHGGERKDN